MYDVGFLMLDGCVGNLFNSMTFMKYFVIVAKSRISCGMYDRLRFINV